MKKKLGRFKNIKRRLEAAFLSGQLYRLKYESTLAEVGPSSKGTKALLDGTAKAGKADPHYVSGVLNRYGWLDYRLIGHEAGAALFLIVQHADSPSQEKYLPLLKRAVREKKAFGSDLALLEDRVLLRRGRKQVYGSRVQCDGTGKACRLLPVEDEKNVDERRKDAGLPPPLAEYLKHRNIVYKKAE